MQKEKRKVNLVGQNTLTVSLPTKFVKENNIVKGDELFSFIEGDSVIFSQIEKKKENKSITIDINELSTYQLTRTLIHLYITNYNHIILKYRKDKIYSNQKEKEENLSSRIRSIVNRYIGGEIISQTSNKTEIECFLNDDSNEDLKKIEKRIYFLFKDMCDELINNLGDNFENYNNLVYNYHDNIDKFIFYFLRKLNISVKSDEEKKIAYSFFNFIGLLTDKIRHLSNQINKYGCSEKLKNYLEKIFELLFEQYNFIYKEKMFETIIKKRYDLVKKIRTENFNIEELRVIIEINIFLDTINIFSAYGHIKSINH